MPYLPGCSPLGLSAHLSRATPSSVDSPKSYSILMRENPLVHGAGERLMLEVAYRVMSHHHGRKHPVTLYFSEPAAFFDDQTIVVICNGVTILEEGLDHFVSFRFQDLSVSYKPVHWRKESRANNYRSGVGSTKAERIIATPQRHLEIRTSQTPHIAARFELPRVEKDCRGSVCQRKFW